MSRRALLGVAALWAVLAGCGDPVPTTFVWVEVQARPAVRGVTRLEVTVSEGGDRVTRTFGDGAAPLALPATFTVTPNAHPGPLALAAVAYDADGMAVGTAAAAVAVTAGGRTDAALLLEPADFQVNSTVAGSQIMADFAGSGGRQLAAAPDGSFAVAFENISPLGRYDGMARLFDADGAPRQNATSMTREDFILNEFGSENVYFVSLAGGPDGGFLATWVDDAALTRNARHFDATGAGGAELVVAPLTASSAASAYIPGEGAAASFADGGFVVVWSDFAAATDNFLGVRARLLDPTGAPRVNDTTGDALDFPVGAPSTHSRERPAVAVGPDGGFVVAWLEFDYPTGRTDIVGQHFSPTGRAQAAEVVLVAALAGAYPDAPNLRATSDGYLLAWADGVAGDADVFVRPLGPDAAPTLPAYRVNTSTDGVQREPGLAVGASTILVVWTDAQPRPEDGDAGSIRARALRPDGLPIGVDFAVNTTTASSQYLASAAAVGDGAFVVAWEDGSAAPPDTDGSGIRARLIYTDGAPDGRVGAACAGGAPACADGLVCVPGDAGSFCHLGCAGASPGQPCVTGGICRGPGLTGAADNACVFK